MILEYFSIVLRPSFKARISKETGRYFDTKVKRLTLLGCKQTSADFFLLSALFTEKRYIFGSLEKMPRSGTTEYVENMHPSFE